MYTFGSTVKIDIRRSNLLNTSEVTASSIVDQDFSNNIFPLFYNAYKPTYSFIIVPSAFLKELALEAEYYDLAEEIVHNLGLVYAEKRKILADMSDKYYERKKLQKKGGEK